MKNIYSTMENVSTPELLGSATSEGWIQEPITRYFAFWRTSGGELVTGNPAEGYVSSQIPSYSGPRGRAHNADTGRVRAILEAQLERMDSVFRKLK
jgi:hypothetical protein